jgi:hypothetical protein
MSIFAKAYLCELCHYDEYTKCALIISAKCHYYEYAI